MGSGVWRRFMFSGLSACRFLRPASGSYKGCLSLLLLDTFSRLTFHSFHSNSLDKGQLVNVSKCQPITSLTPAQTKWKIKCRVLKKSDIIFYNTSKGFGPMVTVVLADEEGTQIQATMFSEAIHNLYSMLQEGRICYISNGAVIKSNPAFRFGPTNHGIILDETSLVVEATDGDTMLCPIRYNILPLNMTQQIINPSTLIVVIDVTPYATTICKRTGMLTTCRSVTLVDQECFHPIQLTMWGTLAIAKGDLIEEKLESMPILLGTAIKVKENEGGSLTTTLNTLIELDPQIKEMHQLRDWAIANRDKFHVPQIKEMQELRDGAIANRDKFQDSDIKSKTRTSFLACEDKNISKVAGKNYTVDPQAKVYKVKAMIEFIDCRRDPWYLACNQCNRKVNDYITTDMCDRCGSKEFQTTYKYLLHTKISDGTSALWMSIFDKEAQKILCYPIDEMRRLKESNDDEFVKCMEECLWKMYQFTMRVSSYKSEEETSPSYTCIDVVLLEEGENLNDRDTTNKDLGFRPYKVYQRRKKRLKGPRTTEGRS